MIPIEQYLDSLEMTLDEADKFLSRLDRGCACVGCPPGVECRPGMCLCMLNHMAARRVVLRAKAQEVRDARNDL